MTFGCHFSEIVIAMEDIISPDGDSGHPNGPYSPEPPDVGFLNEVSVVEHLSLSIMNMIIILD